VLQFADPSSAAHPYAVDLKSPQPIRADLPPGLEHTRLVIACVLDRSGELKGMQVLEPGDAAMTSKVLAALPRWKFQPAMRDGKPVEVSAILGFNIDTNDRF
jgi:TonB family protein